jgi:type I restriction enzyme S subunit
MTPRYQAYRESGVEWLGEVPEHWSETRLASYCGFVQGKAHEPYFDEDGEFVCITARFVSTEGEKRKYCSKMLTPAKTGDIAIVMSDLPNGRALARAYYIDAEETYAINQRVCLISSHEGNPRFLFYVLNRHPELLARDDGVNQTHLPNGAFTRLLLQIPPLPEQTTIAAFLDRETAKIDALVAEQRRLIDLLKEKRQAVISHAVTRGLNPNAPVKPSGIDWLGDVPEGWEVCGVKYFCNHITDGAHISPDTKNGVVPFVSTRDTSDAGIDFENCLQTSEATYEYMKASGCQPERGDILFSKDGTIGRTVIVDTNIVFVVASSLIIIRPDHQQVSCKFLNYLLKSEVVTNQVASFVKGAGLPRLSITNLLKVLGVFPGRDEQDSIVDHLNRETRKFNTLIDTAEQAITLMQERRAALISAAVTGKIDVRALAPSETEAA